MGKCITEYVSEENSENKLESYVESFIKRKRSGSTFNLNFG